MGVIAAPGQRARALELAHRLDLPLLTEAPVMHAGLCVEVMEDAYALVPLGRGSPGPVRVSFDDPALRHRRRAGHNELLGRAVGWRAARAPSVFDATAGFGRDAFTLADLGCEVTLCERNPLMAALLEAAIDEARHADSWLAGVAGRMRLVAGDACAVDRRQLAGVDAIYLDPMFAPARKALPGKEMQVLAALLDTVGSPPDDGELLAWALDQAVRRVVVKRPRRAPPLGGREPGHRLEGRAVRFDVYPLRTDPAVDVLRGPG